MGDNPADCPVCLDTFDDAIRRPRTLPCGHTQCSLCIDYMKDKNHVTCPTCRIRHALPKAGQFPVSYAMEDLVKKLKETEAAAAAFRTPTLWEGEDTATNVRQEQKAKLLAAINTCQEVQAQLGQYHTMLVGWCEQQQWLEGRLQNVINQSQSARVLMQLEKSRAVTKKEEVSKGLQQLEGMLEGLHRVTPTHEALPVSDNNDVFITETELRGKECHRIFPDQAAAVTARKAMVAMTAALEAAQHVHVAQETVIGDADEPLHQPGQARTITERLRDLMEPPSIKVNDLRFLTQPVMRLLEAGQLFAVHQVEGRQRHAKVTTADGRLFLHSLQDQQLPLGAGTLQVSELVPDSPPCLVFLDVAWPESMPRRVLIRVTSDTPVGRQFVLLCTGQRGPSYANTRFFEVWDKGLPGERVMGGDYEKNNGEGGAALVPDLELSAFQRSGRAGAVYGMWGDPARGALFGISTKDVQIGGPFAGVFGNVEAGLDGVVAAAQHSNIKEVVVVDCGVVLWE